MRGTAPRRSRTFRSGRAESSSRPSWTWFADNGKVGFVAQSHLRAQGHDGRSFGGRPVIGIADSRSDLNACNVHLDVLVSEVARGVEQAAGVPMIFPTISLGEPFMDVDEILRANPLGGDRIRLDVSGGRLELLVPVDELTERLTARWTSVTAPVRGRLRIHHEHVMQADRRCDLDLLVGKCGDTVAATSF